MGKRVLLFYYSKGNDKLTWMNLSHNKFSEKSGENLGLGISEIQITLWCIWLDYGDNEKCVTTPNINSLILRAVQAWKSLQAVIKNKNKTKQNKLHRLRGRLESYRRISGIHLNFFVVCFRKCFQLLYNPGIYHEMLNIVAILFSPLRKSKEKKVSWGTRSKRNFRWLLKLFVSFLFPLVFLFLKQEVSEEEVILRFLAWEIRTL